MDLNGASFILRADAREAIGAGHFMRLLAIGQTILEQNGRVAFLTNCNSHYTKRLYAEGFSVEPIEHPHPHPQDLEALTSLQKSNPDNITIIDGYDFDSPYYSKAKCFTKVLVEISDFSCHKIHSDIIINPNFGSRTDGYEIPKNTNALFGPQFSILRKEFTNYKRNLVAKDYENNNNLLISLGGFDQNDTAIRVLECLEHIKAPLHINIVIDNNQKNSPAFISRLKQSKHYITPHCNVKNMIPLMREADIAISNGGGTCRELAYMGVPTAIVSTATNQIMQSQHLHSTKRCLYVGPSHSMTDSDLLNSLTQLLNSEDLRKTLSTNCMREVDGKGCLRIVQAAISLLQNNPLSA